MNQDKHLFQFSGQKIAEACIAETQYRGARIRYWREQQDELVKRAKALTATVEVREFEHSDGKGYTVVAVLTDVQDINQRLDICARKLKGHLRDLREYHLKGMAYGTQPDRMYELDPADVAYFRLNGAEREE